MLKGKVKYALLAVAASWRGARAQRPIAGDPVSLSRDGALAPRHADADGPPAKEGLRVNRSHTYDPKASDPFAPLCTSNAGINGSTFKQTTKRGYRVVDPDLQSAVSTACAPLIRAHTIVWIGGPPGAGKTTVTRRMQEYGFMAVDCEIFGTSRCLAVLQRTTTTVRKYGRTAYVFGACYGSYLLKAPEFVVPVLLLPTFEIYTRRWQKRNPNDRQNHVRRWHSDHDKVASIKRTVTINQTDDRECLDATVHRVCTQVGLRLEQRSNLDGL